MNNRKNLLIIIAFLVVTFSSTVYANFVWPALYLVKSNFSWWVIIIGLIIEYFFVRSLTKASILKSILIDFAMNLASFLLGTVFVPVAGIAWEFFPGIYLYKWFSIGTFNPGTWAATCLFAIFINTFVEKFIIEKLFKYKAGKKGFWWLVFVNTLSVSIAFISMLVFPQEI